MQETLLAGGCLVTSITSQREEKERGDLQMLQLWREKGSRKADNNMVGLSTPL